MGGPVKLLVLLLAASMLALPMASAQGSSTLQNPNESTETTLYFHVFDTFNKFVINTQPMNDTFFDVGGTNFPTLVGTPVNDAYGADFDLNTIYGVSTAGPVEYDFIENGKPRFHPEPGIAADVIMDTSVDPVVYLYVDVRDVLSTGGNIPIAGDNWDGAPNTLPDFTFRVTMREGDDPGQEANLDDGDLIMSGEVTGTLYDGQAAGAANDAVASNPAVAMFVPDESGIIEIAIPLEIANDGIIPKAEAFNVRLDWFQGGSAGYDDQFAEGFMRLVADPDHLPRLELNIMNPIYVEFIHPQVAAGILLIHAGVNSPWGTYDINVEDIQIAVTGPTSPLNLDQVIAQNQHVHGLHDKAAEITYLWRFRDEGAPNGEYKIDFSIPNMVGNSVASGSAGFVIQPKGAYGVDDAGEVIEPTIDEGSKDSPSIGVFAAIGLLGAAILARRR